MSPERAAALADMRAEMAAVNATSAAESPVQQTMRLAGREEPRGLPEVEAIEAELALIAKRRANANPAEIAALEARASELRRLSAAAQAGAAQ